MAENGNLPEGSELVGLQHKQARYQNITKLEWFIGLLCNFDCHYCAEYRRSGYAETEKVLRAVQKIGEKLCHRKVILLLSGGEPSIHPAIEEIAQKIDEEGIRLEMISNGSRDPELYVRMLKHIRGYTFSLHLDQKYKKTLDTIYAVHAAIKARNAKIGHNEWYMMVNVMMVPGYFDLIKPELDRFEAEGVNFVLRRIRPLFDKDNRPILPERIKDRPIAKRVFQDPELFKTDYGYYSPEEIEFMGRYFSEANANTEEFWQTPDGKIVKQHSNSNSVLLRKLNRFKDWKCWVGVERMHIYPTGDVYRSTCKVGGLLGNVYTDFDVPREPIDCSRTRCTCNWAINLSKIKPGVTVDDLRVLQ